MQWVIVQDDTLCHEGKLGMHWGQRRYQKKDGSWTPLGLRLRREREGGPGRKKKPSSDAQKRADRKNEIKNLKSKAELDTAKAAYKINKAQNKSAVQAAKAGVSSVGNKIKGAAKNAIAKHKEKKREESVEELVRSGDLNKILKNKSKLTDEELRSAVNRLNLEQDLKSVGAKQKQNALDTYKRFADTVNTTANLTKNGISIYNNVASVMNTFFDKDMMIIKVGKEGGGEAGRMFGQDAPSRNRNSGSSASNQSSSNSQSSGSNNQNGSSNQSSSGSNGSSSSNSPIRPNETVNERARQRAASANEQRRQSQSSSSSSSSSNPAEGASQRANEGFRQWRENRRSGTVTVEGTGASRRQAESTVDRHARERASAVDVESRNIVENEIVPVYSAEYFRRRA